MNANKKERLFNLEDKALHSVDWHYFRTYIRKVDGRTNRIMAKISERRELLDAAKLIAGRRYFPKLSKSDRCRIAEVILTQSAILAEHSCQNPEDM